MTIEAVLFDVFSVLTGSPWSTVAPVGSGGDEAPVLAVLVVEPRSDRGRFELGRQ